MKLKSKISWLMSKVQRSLFPHLDECLLSPLTGQEKRLVMTLELVCVEKYIVAGYRLGRPMMERAAISRAFVAKAVLRYTHTVSLIHGLNSSPSLRAICGFSLHGKVPSEATFSRAFAEFAEAGLGTAVHDALVKAHLNSVLIGHVSRDSTAIEGREKAARKKVRESKPARKKGRPAAGDVRQHLEKKRIDEQRGQSVKDALAALPNACDHGMKKNAKGFTTAWRGYKLHVDVNDFGLPLSAVLTSASVHDSQVAVPLMKMTSGKVTYLYDMMDAAYDSSQIREASIELGHVPIIDRNARRGGMIPMAPHEARRYNERSAVERFNSNLKENYGGKNVMVRGAAKVMTHLMFGVVALFAGQLIRVAGC